MDLRKRCVNCIPPIRTRLQDCGEHPNPPSFPPAVALSVSIPLQPFPSCPSCPRTFLSLPRWGKTACRLVALLHPLKPVPVWPGWLARQVHPGTKRVLSEPPSPFGSPKHVQGVLFQGLVPQAARSTELCPSKLSTCPQEIKRACPLHPTCPEITSQPTRTQRLVTKRAFCQVNSLSFTSSWSAPSLLDSSPLTRQRQSRLVTDSHLLDRVL